jgi:hypothetical protein
MSTAAEAAQELTEESIAEAAEIAADIADSEAGEA